MKIPILLIVIIVLITLCFYAPPPKSSGDREREQREQKDEVTWERALLAARELHDAMRNPDSFKLTSVLFMDDGSICYEYRAQNGFGGMNVGRAALAANGSFKTNEMNGFAALWNRRCAGKIGENKTWAINYALKSFQ